MHLKTGLAVVSAALLSTAVWAPSAYAEMNTLWYVENHGNGYDLEVDYSATAQYIGKETKPDGKYLLTYKRTVESSDGDTCRFGDESSPNYARATIPTWTPADSLNPAFHTYCWFSSDHGSRTLAAGANVASAKLTAITQDGGRYVVPSGTPGNVFNHLVEPRRGSAYSSTNHRWVTERIGYTGQCTPETGFCGVTSPSWTSTTSPGAFVDVTFNPVGDHFDMVWLVRWYAPEMKMEMTADALGAIRDEDCTIIGTPGNDVLVGTDDDDVICGLGGDDTIDGRGGDDIIKGGAGDDTIDGGAGNDILGGGSGDDTIKGGAGDDLGHGGTGQDTLLGGTGTDHMAGNSGDDTMASQSGDPVVVVNVDGHNVHDSTDATVVEDSDGDGRSGGGDGTAWRDMM